MNNLCISFTVRVAKQTASSSQCCSPDGANPDQDIIKTREHQDRDQTKIFGVSDQNKNHNFIYKTKKKNKTVQNDEYGF